MAGPENRRPAIPQQSKDMIRPPADKMMEPGKQKPGSQSIVKK
jgi:hypothetical protein